MFRGMPTVSLIIPTYNRKEVLRRTLDALRDQTYPLHQVEILVVADGCTDGTVEMLREYQTPFSLRTIEQTNQGPAAARNRGAACAIGQLLVFLDDDVEAAPHLIEAHVRAHLRQPDGVVIGYLSPQLQEQAGLFRSELLTWWEAMFDSMRQSGHRYRYSDMLSGNSSFAAELFKHVGGFDPSFRCHEDYELGVRLLRAGATWAFAVDALAYHREATSLNGSLRRKYQEGRADVLMGRCHPELRPVLPMAQLEAHSLLPSRILRILAFRWPAVGDALAQWLQRALGLLERVRIRCLWRRLLIGLLGYWYWRGVAEELDTLQALSDFLRESPAGTRKAESGIELDLKEGLEAAEGRLDAERPAGACIRYGEQLVGRIRPQPGAERLRGAHLRPILTTCLEVPLLRALTLEGVADIPARAERLLAACDEVLGRGRQHEADCS